MREDAGTGRPIRIDWVNTLKGNGQVCLGMHGVALLTKENTKCQGQYDMAGNVIEWVFMENTVSGTAFAEVLCYENTQSYLAFAP